MPIPPQFMKAAQRAMKKKGKSKLIEGSKAEEKTESPSFEKKEDRAIGFQKGKMG